MPNSEIKVMEVKLNDLKETNSKEHEDIKSLICGIRTELKEHTNTIWDTLKNKADQANVEKLDTRFWWIVGVGLTVGIGLFIFIIEELVKRNLIK